LGKGGNLPSPLVPLPNGRGEQLNSLPPFGGRVGDGGNIGTFFINCSSFWQRNRQIKRRRENEKYFVI